MIDRILSQKQVLNLLPFTRVGLYQMRCKGKFPEPIQLSDRKIGWRESVINAWIAERERAPVTTEALPAEQVAS
jgi:prophage regulatory protein